MVAPVFLWDVVSDVRREGGAVRQHNGVTLHVTVDQENGRFFLAVEVVEGDELVFDRRGVAGGTADEAITAGVPVVDEGVNKYFASAVLREVGR